MTDIPPLLQTLEDLTEEAKSHVILKSVTNGKLIGSVRGCPRPDDCYIGRLIVHPDYQNQGVGRKLMEAIEKELASKRYSLTTGNLDEKNLYLYQKLGYKITEREKVSDTLFFVHMVKEIKC